VIVRDAGDAWQVVLQTDHADLSADCARAWANTGPRHDSLVIAAERHDDGWAVWEQAPMVSEDSKPVNFLDVGVPAHLAFYRAGIAAITEQDPYAGLLVSMHGAGIYRQRYGRDTALGFSRAAEVQDLIDAFVAEQEEGYEGRMAATGVDDERRWADYELLQIYDRFSLYFAMRDLEAGEEAEFQGIRFEPLGPWRVRMDPYPFGESPASLSLLRRLVPKGGVRQDTFAREFFALPADRTAITVED
jgi:Protein of unknown function (DUF3891)